MLPILSYYLSSAIICIQDAALATILTADPSIGSVGEVIYSLVSHSRLIRRVPAHGVTECNFRVRRIALIHQQNVSVLPPSSEGESVRLSLN